MINKWVRDTALASSSVTDLISTRLYAVYLPQTVTLPAVVYREVEGPSPDEWQYNHFSAGGGLAVYVRRFRFEVHSDSLQEAQNVESAIREAIVGAQGTTSDGYTIKNSLWVGNSDNWQDDVEHYVRRLNIEIWHTA